MTSPIPPNDGRMIELTEELIQSVRSSGGGWNKEQLRLMGVQSPPQKGWVKRAAGTRIAVSDWETVARIRNTKTKK